MRRHVLVLMVLVTTAAVSGCGNRCPQEADVADSVLPRMDGVAEVSDVSGVRDDSEDGQAGDGSTQDIPGATVDVALDADAADASGGSDVVIECDPEAWIQSRHESFTCGVSDPNRAAAGPPPYDEECRPAPDRSCKSVCDCKFTMIGACFVSASSVASPWSCWDFLGRFPMSEECNGGVECFIGADLHSHSLACIDGACLAIGPSGDDAVEFMLGMAGYFGPGGLRHLLDEEYTNDPIYVGAGGFEAVCDSLAAPVQVVKNDDTVAVIHTAVLASFPLWEYHVDDGGQSLGLEGVEILWNGRKLLLDDPEVLHGSVDAVSSWAIACNGSCPWIRTTTDGTTWEGPYDANTGLCTIPFLLGGVTYEAVLPRTDCGFASCQPWSSHWSEEVYLFARKVEEDGPVHVIAPFPVKDGIVESPCCPLGAKTPEQFEAQLAVAFGE